jgi:hypothetical protein
MIYPSVRADYWDGLLRAHARRRWYQRAPSAVCRWHQHVWSLIASRHGSPRMIDFFLFYSILKSQSASISHRRDRPWSSYNPATNETTVIWVRRNNHIRSLDLIDQPRRRRRQAPVNHAITSLLAFGAGGTRNTPPITRAPRTCLAFPSPCFQLFFCFAK